MAARNLGLYLLFVVLIAPRSARASNSTSSTGRRATAPLHSFPTTDTATAPPPQFSTIGAAHTATTACSRPQVAWDGVLGLGSAFGFSMELVEFVKALQHSPVHLTLFFNVLHPEFFDTLTPEDRALIAKARDAKPEQRPQVWISQCLPGMYGARQHEFEQRDKPVPGYRRIARLMYESTTIPKGWFNDAKLMDEIWVPTEWGRQIFVENQFFPPDKLSNIKVVAEGVDCKIFDPERYSKNESRRALLPNVGDRFVFLASGAWTERKNYDLLVDAFLEEFKGEERDKVRLVIRTAVPPAVVAKGNGSIIEMARLDINNLTMLYRAVDAFVTTTHAEGFGRPPLEALAMGLPVIATNWSALTDFVTNNHAFPIPVHDFESFVNVGMQWPYRWAKVEQAEVRKRLRQVFNGGDEVAAVAARGRPFVLKNFDTPIIGHQIYRAIHDTCHKIPAHP